MEVGEGYSKEYGKKMEGSVSIQSLTGSPFTIINKVSLIGMSSCSSSM